ncbi:MAG: hypothetical protein Q4D28_09760, partial [Prevotellaceae bacterium]|nr:hypothetical protein [Prevotellaceae bacterium]
METENENIQEQNSANAQNESAHEGNYQPRQPRQRVRITTQRANYGDRPQYGDRPRPSYNRSNGDSSFMPEGFGSALGGNRQQDGGENGYQQRNGYN